MSQADDLMHVAELIKLATQTARTIAAHADTGATLRIVEIADRIDADADELEQIGRKLADDEGPYGAPFSF